MSPVLRYGYDYNSDDYDNNLYPRTVDPVCAAASAVNAEGGVCVTMCWAEGHWLCIGPKAIVM